MATSVLNHLDFGSSQQIKNVLFDIKSTIPTGVPGQFLYNASTNKFGYFNGTSWVYPNEYSLPTATASVLGGVKVGTTLEISSGVLNQKSGVATAGTYRSVTVDTYGRVTAGSNPTTLSGYGITDAKIANGVITLGSNTITPATTAMLGNAVPNQTTANKILLSTTTGGTSAWSSWSTKGILQTDTNGAVSVKTPTIWGVTFTGDNVTGVPNLYIGTTKVQTSSTAQHVTGVSSLTIGDAVLSYDSTTHALKLEKRSGTTTDIGFYAEGFVSAFGPSATEGGGTDITAEDIISILNAYTPGEKIKAEVLDVTGGGGGLSWTDLENATSTSHIINASHLPSNITGLVSRVTTLESSATTGVTTTGSGNAITSVSKSGNTITFTKGSSFPVLSGGKIPLTYIPDVLLGQVLYGGTLAGSAVATLSTNAKTKLGTTSNTITLTNNTTAITGYAANEGIYYIVETAQTFAGISFEQGDWLISTGSAWKKIDNTDAVTGIKGNAETNYRIGQVNITPENIGLASASAFGTVKIGSGINVSNGVISVTAYTLPLAANGTRGGIQIGYTASGANIPVQLSSEKAYVALTSTAVTSALGSTNLVTSISVPTGLSVTNPTGVGAATIAFASGYSIPTTAKQNEWDAAKSALTHTYSISGSTVTTYTTTYDFSSNNLVWALYDSSDNAVISDISIVKNSSNKYAVKVTFAAAIGSATYRLVVIGI